MLRSPDEYCFSEYRTAPISPSDVFPSSAILWSAEKCSATTPQSSPEPIDVLKDGVRHRGSARIGGYLNPESRTSPTHPMQGQAATTHENGTLSSDKAILNTCVFLWGNSFSNFHFRCSTSSNARPNSCTCGSLGTRCPSA